MGSDWRWTVEEVSSSDYCQAEDTTTAYEAGAWVHFVLTYDASAGACRIYANSVLAADTTNPNNPANVNAANSQNFSIGARYDGASGFSGELDDVRIYNRVLSAAEITRLYQLGQ